MKRSVSITLSGLFLFGSLSLPAAQRSDGGDRADSKLVTRPMPAPTPSLRYLPWNNRYLQYKGLPCVLFWGTHHWGWRAHPTAEQLRVTAAYANFTTLQASDFRYSTYGELWERAGDTAYWRRIAASVEAALELDLIVHLYFFDGHYRVENAVYPSASDFLFPARLDEDLAAFGLPGRTRRQVHERILDQAAIHLAGFPNLIVDPVFESTPLFKLLGHGADDFCRWWADGWRQRSEEAAPGCRQLLGTMLRETAPAARNMDVLLGEHESDGFFSDPTRLTSKIYDYRVPMLRMALRAPEPFTSQMSPMEVRTKVALGHPVQHLMIEQIVHGVHTAEHYNLTAENTWVTQADDLQRWFLQARWYLENIKTWDGEPGFHGGDEITRERLPLHNGSARPRLENPAGYARGVRLLDDVWEFAVLYHSTDDTDPWLAEVWVDRTGRGYFDPNPAHGDRLAMTRTKREQSGAAYYTVRVPHAETAPGARYVFRFAGRDWLPPAPGGLVPDNTPGISYESWPLTRPE